MNYTRHPTDDSLLIGDNGHIYAATRLPHTGWNFAVAWDILDVLKPGAISNEARLLLAGMIAATVERAALVGPFVSETNEEANKKKRAD